eukprot:Rmarinus@m.17649
MVFFSYYECGPTDQRPSEEPSKLKGQVSIKGAQVFLGFHDVLVMDEDLEDDDIISGLVVPPNPGDYASRIPPVSALAQVMKTAVVEPVDKVRDRDSVPEEEEVTNYRTHLAYATYKTGWIKKKGHGSSLGSGWKERFLALENGTLAYYGQGPTEQAPERGPADLKMKYDLIDATVKDAVDGRNKKNADLRFTVVFTGDESLAIEAKTMESKREWIETIEKAIAEAKDIDNRLVKKEGWMLKKGRGQSFGSGWKDRYFRLQSGVLRYFEDENSRECGPGEKGSFELAGSELLGVDHGKRNLNLRFRLVRADDELELETKNEIDVAEWTELLCIAIEQMNSIWGYQRTLTASTTVRVLKGGWLLKQGKGRKVWRPRYFKLTTKQLTYYADERCQDCKGIVDLDMALIETDMSLFQHEIDLQELAQAWPTSSSNVVGTNDHADGPSLSDVFVVRCGEKCVFIAYPNEEERLSWLTALKSSVKKLGVDLFDMHEVRIATDVLLGEADLSISITNKTTVGDILAEVTSGKLKSNLKRENLAVFETITKQGKVVRHAVLPNSELVHDVLRGWNNDARRIFGVRKFGPNSGFALGVWAVRPDDCTVVLSATEKVVSFSLPSLTDAFSWYDALQRAISRT